MEKMTDVQKELYSAFRLLAGVPVSGDVVDIMSGVREHLRNAYKMAATDVKETKSDG